MRRSFLSALAVLLSASGFMPAMAHHSFAMFDQTKTVVLQGVISRFEWTNPHVFVFVDVKKNGKSVTHALEGSSPSLMRHAGWTFDTLKPGDMVEVTVHPVKESNARGMLVTVKLPNGQTLKGW